MSDISKELDKIDTELSQMHVRADKLEALVTAAKAAYSAIEDASDSRLGFDDATKALIDAFDADLWERMKPLQQTLDAIVSRIRWLEDESTRLSRIAESTQQ